MLLNYRTPHLVRDAVSTIVGQLRQIGSSTVVVIDNASDDDSAKQIQSEITCNGWSDVVGLVQAPTNGGFSAGNNVGITTVSAERYLLINSDTLVRDGAIAELMAAMDANPQAGLVSPRLEWPDGTPQQSCFRERRPIDEFFRAARTGWLEQLCNVAPRTHFVSNAPMICDWTSFACVLVRREVVEQIGLMDEGYFMYFDDIDYCRMARARGWSVLHWPAAHVVHLRGGSSPVKSLCAQRERPPKYWYESRSRYYAKHFGRRGLWRANAYWHAGRVVSFLRELLLREEPTTNAVEWRDIWTNAGSPMRPAG